MKTVLISMIMMFVGVMIGYFLCWLRSLKKEKKDVQIWRKLSDKYMDMFMLMNQWIKIYQSGDAVEKYFEEEGYRSVIIYGMNFIGDRLWNELRNTEINVICGIDKKAKSIISDLPLITSNEEIPQADVIVVTAISSYDAIENDLSKRVKCNIVSIEDVIYSI